MAKEHDLDKLLEKMASLEAELRNKDLELAKYRSEITKTNSELEKIISTLGQELKMASQIQRVLTPTEIPTIPGFEFSTKFVPGSDKGGDYFDIFEHEDKMKFGIVLACSSGYTMSALFLSVLIKLSSQIEARKGFPADQVLIKMAKELIPGIDGPDYASVFYGIMDRRSFEFQYSSVGKMMGYLLPMGSETITRLQPSSGPFQKNYDQKPLAQSLQFNSRDRLILCSEGVLDVTNNAGQSFGVDRLSKAILNAAKNGVHDIRNEILFQIEQFTGLSEPLRDQTLIVMEVKDRVIKLAKHTST